MCMRLYFCVCTECMLMHILCTNIYLDMFDGKILINQINYKNLTNRDNFIKKLFCRTTQSYLQWIKHNINCFLLNSWKKVSL